MQRFILQKNIERFEGLLVSGAGNQDWVKAALASARRELTLLEAALDGVKKGPMHLGGRWAQDVRERVLAELRSSSEALLLIDAGPGLRLVELTDAYADLIGRSRAALLGRPLFEAFPEDPDQPLADGAVSLLQSLKMAAETRRPHAMNPIRYDVATDDGRFVERHWRPVNTPLFDAAGEVAYILNRPGPCDDSSDVASGSISQA